MLLRKMCSLFFYKGQDPDPKIKKISSPKAKIWI